jgi:hypothetical protein
MDPYHRITPGSPMDTLEGLSRRVMEIEGMLQSLPPQEVTVPTPQGATFMTILGKEIGLADIRDFNIRLLGARITVNEDGESIVAGDLFADAPYIIRVRDGLVTHGWAEDTPVEVRASGIDPAVPTYDVISVIQGASGQTGPGYTPPAEPA